MAEMRFVTEVAARRGEVLTHTPVGESSASTAEMARTEASDVSAAAEAADASATEPAADMSASAEPTGVSTTEAATMSTAAAMATAATSAARKCISGQSGGESGSRCEDDHRRT